MLSETITNAERTKCHRSDSKWSTKDISLAGLFVLVNFFKKDGIITPCKVLIILGRGQKKGSE